MSSYLTAEQHQQLLRDLNPKRIGKDGKGFSHLQAWDCRAHMNRIFGFARWDEETPEMHLLFDTESEGNGKTRYTVAYKALVVVRVRAEDKSAQVDAFVALVEQGPPEGTALVRWHAKLLARATAERLLNEEAPGGVTVKTFIDLARDQRKAS
jgi:hypothetical protein